MSVFFTIENCVYSKTDEVSVLIVLLLTSIVCHRSTNEHLMGHNIQTLCQSPQMLSIEVNKTLDSIR